MPEIHLLNQSTIDKIAAGEVVERPLSVVKELTENAIDAGARAVTVEIKDGGISFIRVTDNGCGIDKGQVKKAFLRHATSKITSIEDLSHVASLGFRGEALSSIAAVAQVELITKTEKELTGVRYAIAGGKEEEFEEIGAPNGTTFLIRNLFFNTPVRKKFLKQPQTEGGYVADMMEHLALSRPEISIKFIQNGRLRFHTSGNGNLKEVIYRIYGKDMTDALIPFEARGNGFSVIGFLGKPEINRANRNFETYFVNGRYVKNDILTKAVEEGYRAFLMQHKFPFCVLHFQMEPAEIDVNVHPAKMEIRLIHGSGLYEEISGAVRERLRNMELIPNVRFEEKEKIKSAASRRETAPEPFEERRAAMLKVSMPESGMSETAKPELTMPDLSMPDLEMQDLAMPTEKETPVRSDIPYKTPAVMEDAAVYQAKMTGNRIIGNENGGNFHGNEGIHANIIKAGEHILVEKPAQLNLFEDKFLSRDAKEDYKILGQIFDTYWLVAFKDRLFIIDQHAAHEKVKYERMVKELKEKKISSQMLNPPVIVTLTGKEEEILREYLDYFVQMGFEIEEFGASSYAIRSMPADLYGCNEKEFFSGLLDELAVQPSRSACAGTEEVILQKLASMACKAAVKGNNALKTQEAAALIDELLTLENPYHCPHGRPTIISMSKYELEKKFKRII